MVNVRIDEEVLLDMLDERVKFWTDDKEVQSLYHEYYDNLVNSGCLDGMELDIPVIVDNDYVNYFAVVCEDEFDNYSILSDTDDRIEAAIDDEEGTRWYLVRTC